MSLPKGAINRQMNSQEIMNTPFLLFQSHKDDYYNMSQESVRGIQQETVLSKVFFHPKNVDLVQKQLIMEVLRRTGGEFWIEKQDEKDLQVVMRSIYFQHARHAPDNIRGQIKELNNLTVDELFPGVFSEIKAYFGYLERAFGPFQVIDRPEYTSSAGTRSLLV